MKKQNILKTVLATAMLVAVMAPAVNAQTIANTFTNLSVLPASLTSGSTSNLTSAPIFVNPGYGVSLQISATTGAGVTGSNLTAKVSVSIDGTNWTTVAPYSAVFSLTASSTNTYATNFPSWFFDGFAKVRVESLTTSTTNSLTINSLQLGRAMQLFTH